ncbi:MAG: hypothetical protein V4592_26365 [Bacteroidota bacterium]
MKYLYLLLCILSVQSISAQTKLPVIRATSKRATINDDGNLERNNWTLTPSARPDVFIADRTRKTKYVTFHTDIDSIRVKVKPGTKYDFVILLNGKDSCYTQVVSAISPEMMVKSKVITHDTIPFTLTDNSAIKVRAVINNTDTLNLHFDVGSFDFHLTRDAILKKTKLLANQPDALAGKVAPNYNRLAKVFKLQMGNLIWDKPEVMPTGISAEEMDGRFGWNLFEGKQVELDYDRNLIIIHSTLPKELKGYVKSKLNFINSYVCVKGAFEVGNKAYSGNFLMDTGSPLALILDSAWSAKQSFVKDLKLLHTSILRDPRGVEYEIKTVLTPSFKINTFGLNNVPAVVLSNKNPTGFSINYVGNDLLKRFNMILDFGKDEIYLKPNQLAGIKYKG